MTPTTKHNDLNNSYLNTWQESIQHPDTFWLNQASVLPWFKAPTQGLSSDAQGLDCWFADGEMNTCYMALDHHVKEGRGGQIALIYDSPVTHSLRKYTYQELHHKVSCLAGGLRGMGVKKGDRVLIYMPMVPEVIMAMLAVARLGAVHSVVYGGFAAHELALRLDDAQPKAILSASCGIEVDRVIPYKPIIDRGIAEASYKPDHVVYLERDQHPVVLGEARDHDWQQLMAESKPVPCVPVMATDPLYILYTSGTTGKPKGIIRDNGGHAVALKYSMDYIYHVQQGDVFWAASDVGWAVGHSYIAYAPLIQGCTTVVYEGKPVKTPDASAFWRVIHEHRVKVFFTAPTAFRAIAREDHQGHLMASYPPDDLERIFVAGERCDRATLEWLMELTGTPVIDHWWQTETGWPVLVNPVGIEFMPIKPGSVSRPVPGYDVKILDPEGNEMDANQEGAVAIKLPLPPGCLPNLWNDTPRFRDGYLDPFPGYYYAGDGGYYDDDGYFFITGRLDDIINVAGHRLSTVEMEEIVAAHPYVAECAVIGIADDLKGQRPLGLVVPQQDIDEEERQKLEQALVQSVRDKIGAFAFFRQIIPVERLPKTRSGKILRRTLRSLADGQAFKLPSTVDDPAIIDEIKQVMQQYGLASTPS